MTRCWKEIMWWLSCRTASENGKQIMKEQQIVDHCTESGPPGRHSADVCRAPLGGDEVDRCWWNWSTTSSASCMPLLRHSADTRHQCQERPGPNSVRNKKATRASAAMKTWDTKGACIKGGAKGRGFSHCAWKTPRHQEFFTSQWLKKFFFLRRSNCLIL